eukprot:TRINITY_DN14106_c1_g1_i1.p1 TRINITY_DN14106_c1_g1~~TRINITY_DN14106_c1_g1_i1.p1  ORF type:complete len:250 (-),score=47.92 TRINITY_DN14106_c1_g1_i1:46-723(-)
MTAADWLGSAPRTLDMSHFTGIGMKEDIDTPLARIYANEVKEIIRELLPACKDIDCDPECARRGPGTHNPTYSFAVHHDYGFTFDDWPPSKPGVRERFDSPDVRGMMAVNVWRPVLPMKGPVVKTPLAVCDPRSVKFEDIIPISIRWDNMGFHRMLALAHDEGQQWYYYPDMTTDEVLLFRSFQFFKNQSGPELNSCFHTAFEVPGAPPGAEPRQSAEYRVRVWF